MEPFSSGRVHVDPSTYGRTPLGHTHHAKDVATVCFPVRLYKETASPIGILLEGTSEEHPTIINITKGSIAAKARPRLKKQMRVLAVNGKRVTGPSKISEELRTATGEVWMEVEGIAPSAKSAKRAWGSGAVSVQKAAKLRKTVNLLHEAATEQELEQEQITGKLSKEQEQITGKLSKKAARVPGAVDVRKAAKLSKSLSALHVAAATSSMTVTLQNQQKLCTLGLVLSGKPEEVPYIVQVIPDTIASASQPPLLPGMRILKVGNELARGAAQTTIRALEISVEQGHVALEVQGGIEPTSNGRFGSPRNLKGPSPSRKTRTGMKWKRVGTVVGLEEAFAKELLPPLPGGVAAGDVGVVKLNSQAKKAISDAVTEALGHAVTDVAAAVDDEEDQQGWTLEAWLSALEPHRVLSQGLQELMKERVKDAGQQYTATLEYHFVRTIGSMPVESAMKLLKALIGHPQVVRVLAQLLLDGAKMVSNAAPREKGVVFAQDQMAGPAAADSMVVDSSSPWTSPRQTAGMSSYLRVTSTGGAEPTDKAEVELPQDSTHSRVHVEPVESPFGHSGDAAPRLEIHQQSSLGADSSIAGSANVLVKNAAALASLSAHTRKEEVAEMERQHQREIEGMEVETQRLQAKLEEAEAAEKAAESAANNAAEMAAAKAAERQAESEEADREAPAEEAAKKAREAAEQEEARLAKAREEKEFAKRNAQAALERSMILRAEKRRLEREAHLEVERKEQEAHEAFLKFEKQKEREKRKLAEELFSSQQALMEANLKLKEGGTPVLLDRFVENNPAGFDLKYGTLTDFRGGLEQLLGSAAPREEEAMADMEAEHTMRADSDTEFTVYNYGTVTCSRAEFFFVAEPTPQRLAKLGLEHWPIDTKLRDAGRYQREPLGAVAFRKVRLRINKDLKEAGAAPFSIEEFVASRLYTGPMCKLRGETQRIMSLHHPVDAKNISHEATLHAPHCMRRRYEV